MPRDVDNRTLPNDPSSSLHASTKDYSEKVKVSSDDTTAAHLFAKLAAGTNVTLTKKNAGANETVEIAAAAAGLPWTEDSGTLVLFAVIGAMKFAIWGGIVGEDPVTIIAADDNKVTECLTCMSVVYTPYTFGEGEAGSVSADVFTQIAQAQFPYEGGAAQLIPGGNSYAFFSRHDALNHLLAEIQINVEDDGSVTITRTMSTSDFYVAMFLMWI